MRKPAKLVRVCAMLANNNVRGVMFHVRVRHTWKFDTKVDGEGEAEGGRVRGG